MSKDQIFRFRLDEADRARLDALAEYYSAPAATVVRILIKDKARLITSKLGDLGLDELKEVLAEWERLGVIEPLTPERQAEVDAAAEAEPLPPRYAGLYAAKAAQEADELAALLGVSRADAVATALLRGLEVIRAERDPKRAVTFPPNDSPDPRKPTPKPRRKPGK